MPKKIILRFRAQDKEIFNAIKDGRKTVETRAGTVKYQKVQAGDSVVCVCGKEKLEKEIAAFAIFKTPEALAKKYKVQNIHPAAASLEDLLKMWHSFPGYQEKIAKFGIAAFELQ